MSKVLRALPLLLANALSLLLLRLPGTGDVAQFLRWAVKMQDWGLVEGYHVGNNPYPPLSPLLLAGAGRWAQLAGLEPRAALKLLLLAMLLLSTLIVLAWTRSLLFAGLFQLGLLLNSAALGYLDVLFLPPLLLSFWALQRGRLALASLMFGLTVMTKFQPAVLTPLLLIHALGPSRGSNRGSNRGAPGGAARGGAPDGLGPGQEDGSRGRRAWAAVLPALAVFLLTLAVFGLPLLDKLRRVTLDWYLCGGAFNLSWIATWLIRVAAPGWAGGLGPGGVCPMISEIDPLYMWPSKLLFLLAYAAILVAYWRRPKTFANLLLWSTIAFLAAWLLSAGMHENHVYVAQVLALLLAWFDRRHVLTAVFWSVAANLNLLLTVGVAGGPVDPVRAVAGLDIGLILSAINLAAFGLLVVRARRA